MATDNYRNGASGDHDTRSREDNHARSASMVKTGAIATLEFVVNRALALDPASRTQLAALQGQVFHLECTQPALDMFLILHGDRVQLAGQWQGEVTAGLRGTGSDYTELLASTDPGATLINGAMTVSGNSKALLRLRDIAAHLDIDWEAPLANAFGDVVGHQLGRSLRFGGRLLADAVTSLRRQVHDYVQDESDWLVPRWQLDPFRADVAEAARRGEQLAQNIARLRQRIQQSSRARGQHGVDGSTRTP
jgi:ubiquinone biosynthesis protein UbiJ